MLTPQPPAIAAPADSMRAGHVPAARTLHALSCIVPCYNEAENLQRLLPLLQAQLAQVAERWEIVLVDDGSTDASAQFMAQWAQQDGVRVVQLSRNFGKEAALTAGLEAAVGDVVVMMDADLQHPLALLDTFVRHWRAGADVVYAVREHRDGESWFKRIGAGWFYGMVNGGRFKVPANAGDFRLMDRSVVQALLALPERNRFMKGLYAWVGFEAVAVTYLPEERGHGHSHFNKWRLLRLALDGLFAFTLWPLRTVIMVGFLLALAAFAYGAYLTAVYLLYGHTVNGWTTIVVSLMLFAGIQLVSLGVVGEYVGRIYEETKRRPIFVVKRDLGVGLKHTTLPAQATHSGTRSEA